MREVFVDYYFYGLFIIKALAETVYGVLSFPFRKRFEVPDVHCMDTPVNAFLLNRCPATQKYRPTPWAYGQHSQTVYPSLIWGPRATYVRESVVLSDGVEVALDWASADDLPDDAPIVFCLHGLCGSSDAVYARVLSNECVARRWRAVTYNRRGHAGMPITPRGGGGGPSGTGAPRSPYPKHVDIPDLEEVLAHVTARHPGARLYGVGFSAGSNLLVKYCGGHAQAHPFSGIVSVANAFDLVEATQWLKTRPMVDAIMTSVLRGLWRKLHPQVLQLCGASKLDAPTLKRSRSVRAFEGDCIVRIYDYPHVDAYYDEVSCVRDLPRVNVPALCLGSRDDPVVHSSALGHAIRAAETNPHLLVVSTELGGHLGWMAGWRGRGWWYELITQYLEAVIDLSQAPPTSKEGHKWMRSEDGAAAM